MNPTRARQTIAILAALVAFSTACSGGAKPLADDSASQAIAYSQTYAAIDTLLRDVPDVFESAERAFASVAAGTPSAALLRRARAAVATANFALGATAFATDGALSALPIHQRAPVLAAIAAAANGVRAMGATVDALGGVVRGEQRDRLGRLYPPLKQLQDNARAAARFLRDARTQLGAARDKVRVALCSLTVTDSALRSALPQGITCR